jgi:hypothetical protein
MHFAFKKHALAAIMLSAVVTSPAFSADNFAISSGPAIHAGIDEFSSQDRDHGRPGPGKPGPGRPGPGRPGPGPGRPGFGPGPGHPGFGPGPGRPGFAGRPGFRVGGGRPFRGWVRRPYYGTILGGIALGTVIGVAVAGTVPEAPAPNTCWFWSDPSYSQGYWDYCVAP